MTVTESFKNAVVKNFGPQPDLSDDEYDKLFSLTKIFQNELEDLYIEWESFNFAENEDYKLQMVNLTKFHDYLQKKLTNNKFTPNISKTKDINSGRKPLSKRSINNENTPSTPQIKKRKVLESSSPAPADYDTANSTFNTSPIKPAKQSHTLIETLNPHIENFELNNTDNNPIKLTANFDPLKFKFRTLQMKLLESADVLDDQIDTMAEIYQEENKTEDLQFGNPCLSSQFDILCCGRIVPDSPSYNQEILNKKSLYLETSRLSGVGQRVPLDLSGLNGYSFFTGQIVILKGRNPTGKEFCVEQVMPLPQLGTSVSSKEELEEFESLQNGEGLKVVIASGPYTNSNKLNFTKLENLIEKLNTEIHPNVIILNGPFIDLTNKEVEEGDFPSLPKDQQPRNLDDVFRMLITPILKKIDSKIQVIILPSLKDSSANHCSYPQDSFDRKKLQLPKNVKCFPNPSSFAVNEMLIGSSNLDIFKDLKEVLKQDDSISNNRFDRIITHIIEQRRYYPVMPGSIASTATHSDNNISDLANGASGEFLNGLSIGGSCLEIPYMGLSELGTSIPDVLILPSDLKAFAKIVKGVVVINTGQFIRPSKSSEVEDGTYAILSLLPPKVDEGGENNVEKVETEDNVYHHNIYKRSRIDLYTT
ncbi:POL12 [Candida pseudojiufengensis]|uniref:POL12 n=1 Tax=Candida pseudojiufengensis TaxID=497109 RepID=UPI0022242590|nr:POL12 [Candida pseudojiufengensis]KAI5960587.1 POL12 [Candida pseudojiufengensis]